MKGDSPNGVRLALEEENHAVPIVGRDSSPMTQNKDVFGSSGAVGKRREVQEIGARGRHGQCCETRGAPACKEQRLFPSFSCTSVTVNEQTLIHYYC